MSEELVAVEAPDEIDLFHYASKYYDPVKAKEYYERTKKLKGRKKASTEKLTADQRARISSGQSYAREQVTKQRNAAKKDLAAKQKARLEKLQKTAEETRDRIVQKLEDLVEKLKAGIDEEVPAPKLNEIPANASPKQRAFLEKQNQRMMSVYKGKRAKAAKKASEAAGEAREAAREEIKAVGTSLKDAVTKAREDYKSKQEAVKAKYDKALKTELKNIQDKVR